MNKKLYVGNLVYEASDDDLKQLFGSIGTVVSAAIIRYQDTGRSKGFGFVEMSTEEEAQKAIDTLNGQDNKGRKLVVSEARPPRPRGSFGGGGDRSFGGGDRSFGGGGDQNNDFGGGR